MSVEARELMMDEWTRWQGHIVNGVYPLGRLLGCSEHSGVFLTRSDSPGQREVAIKLSPASLPHVELQLPRWEKAGSLAHPHLIPLLESGTCQLDGLTYLYVVMEYADQTLAQVLLQRALTAEEAREMLLPVLEALGLLHRQDLVLGQLKPANVMVVGDQLKLASDTIRSVDEDPPSVYAPTAYDAPEGRTSTAIDIYGLGATLFEALTRRSPPNPAGHRNAALLPTDFSPEFRDVVSSCLRPMPQDRPDVIELVAWASGQSGPSMPGAITPEAIIPPAAPAARSEPRTSLAAPPRAVPSQATLKARTPVRFSKPQASIAAIVVAAMIVALGWTAVHLFWTHRTPEILGASSSAELPSQISGAAAPAPAQPSANVQTPMPLNPGAGDAKTPSTMHEAIPNVPKSAARTIRGHIKVSVRATVSADGTVSAVAADRSGASGYFRRLAEEAAKKWTFVPMHTAPPRPMQIQFDFTRDGTTGHAVPIH
jgi:serine/threonine protein kinase